MGQFELEELHGIVERQIRVYGDAMDRIALEVTQRYGLPELVDFIQAIKINCGLGKRVVTKPNGEYKIRPYVHDDDAERMILEFLQKHRGRKFRSRDIMINVEGRISAYGWGKARTKLLGKKLIQSSGGAGSQVYWVDYNVQTHSRP